MKRLELIRGEARGEQGSLPMVMLVMIIGIGLSAVLLPVLLRQDHQTRTDLYRNSQLGAAESGIDVTLGLIRTAVDATGAGVTARLPCAAAPTTAVPGGHPLTGSVDGAALTYSTTLTYYAMDPTGQAADWLAVYDPATAPNGHGMLCQAPYGTYLPQGPPIPPATCPATAPTNGNCSGPSWNTATAQVPSYVRITSTGGDSHGWRTLQAVYKVQTTNANVAGGTIYIYPSSSQTYCMDAGSAVPTAGTPILLKKCLGASSPRQQQLWAYQPDLSIQLVSSVGSTYPNGLCVTDGTVYASNPLNASEAAGEGIVLQPCAVAPNAPWYQQWSVDADAYLRGAKPPAGGGPLPGIDINSYCIQITSQADGIPLKLQSCPSSGSVKDVNNTWIESPDVGPGSAGAASGDVVNFLQFGRCLDVTNQNVSGTWPTDGTAGGNNYLIAYTCKQNPSHKLDWNQVFTYQPTTGRWITCSGAPAGQTSLSSCASASQYCLWSPLSPSTEAESGTGPYVVVKACSGCPSALNASNNCMWTRYGGTDAAGNPQPANLKYTIQDGKGYCLDIGTNSADFHVGQYPKVLVVACNGSKQQEWNGLPDIQTPIVQGYTEIANPAT